MIPGITASRPKEVIVEAGDPHWNNVSLLMSFDEDTGLLTDKTGKHVPYWRGPVGTSGGAFVDSDSYWPGYGDKNYLIVPNHEDFLFGSEPFTVEFWCWSPTSGSLGGLICLYRRSDNQRSWAITTSGTVPVVYLSENGTAADFDVVASSGLTRNTWHHIALCRDEGGLVRLYLDGAVVLEQNFPAALNDSLADLVIRNYDSEGGTYSSAYLDELRITKGVCRYAAPFTRPDEPFWYPALPPQETTPLPEFQNVRYWFSGDSGVFSDEAAIVPCADGDPVYHWLNSGYARDHGVQPVEANRPIFKTGGINGKPFIRADGAGQFFENLIVGSQPQGVTSYAPYSVFAVVDNIRANGTAAPSLLGGNPGLKACVWFTDNNGVNAFRFFKNDPQIVFNLPDSEGPNIIFGRKTDSSVGAHAWGTQSNAPTTISDTTNPNSSSSNGMQFFRHNGADFFDGDVYELIYYYGDISLAAAQTVIDYLKAKYGIV